MFFLAQKFALKFALFCELGDGYNHMRLYKFSLIRLENFISCSKIPITISSS